MFKWYDKHFDRVEIVNPVPRTRMRGEVICTSDPKVLAMLKQYRERVPVLAVELDPNSIGLQTVKSITVKVMSIRTANSLPEKISAPSPTSL